MGNNLKLLASLCITIIATLIGSIITIYTKLVEPIYGILVCLLALILITIGFSAWYFYNKVNQISRIEKSVNQILKLLDIIVGWVGKAREKLLAAKKPKISDIISAFDEGAREIAQEVTVSYFSMLKTGNPNSHAEQRKRYLLEKARERTITLSEAEELRKLLENQKKEHERRGDILGAIFAGLLLIFLFGVLAALFGEEKK